ncbi:DegT/DnrJ/EryC1/StrS family aminotransferase [Polyangium fumosum]|uniref:DegT/DnrJ/EryC1/StrS family aminotransferase n=1 Tax=Polyangium fumosum TaxID=889272 RepID=A0A4U1JHP9_9BACT|nr:DegT/DnrJ/EryC1/StrS family aminotransferase [Polyangium fumosum]TKD12112.1 DegT/DnrJ/EryC1/StrS family aminotransferase [Polyangium fumosum]
MWKIPLCDLHFGPEEAQAAADVVASGWLTMGERTQAFERALGEAFGTTGVLAMTNCTAALHLAYLAVGAGPGDEVICPSLTFVATANAALTTGADVVLADIVGPDDLTIDPADVERKITKRTKAITVVHYAGYPCDMDAILAIAERHGVAVIEDAAHAPLATWKGRALGTIGDVGCYSFFSNKNLSTGEGGAVAARTEELRQRCKLLRSHGMTTLTLERHKGHAFSYDVVLAGQNYRIDEIRSAIGLVQLGRLAEGNRMRRAVVTRYRDRLGALDRVHVPFRDFEARGVGESAYHIMPVLLPEGAPREAVMAAMKARGIQTSVHYLPIHAFSFHGTSERVRRDNLARTDVLAPRELTLPLYPRMTDAQVDEVCAALDASLREVFPG